MTTIQGVIHGKTIELEPPPGLPDGEIVAVTIQRITDAAPPVDPELVGSVDVWMERLVFDSSVLPGERIRARPRTKTSKPLLRRPRLVAMWLPLRVGF